MAEVEVHQTLPFLGRTPLQSDPRTGVAAATHLAGLVVELLDGIEPAFQRITHAIGLARRQPLGVRQVLDQGATVVIADLQTVHGLHPGDAHQPAFRGLALVTDATEGVIGFGGVTTLTRFLEDGLGVAGCQAIRRMQRHTGGHGQQAGAQA